MSLAIVERESVLGECPVFASVDAATIRLIAEMVREQRFAAGELVCRAGEPATELYVIARGELAVTIGDRAVRTLLRPSVFGEYGMFGDGLRTATVTATSDALLLALEYDRFRELLLEFPEACLALLALTVERLIDKERS